MRYREIRRAPREIEAVLWDGSPEAEEALGVMYGPNVRFGDLQGSGGEIYRTMWIRVGVEPNGDPLWGCRTQGWYYSKEGGYYGQHGRATFEMHWETIDSEVDR